MTAPETVGTSPEDGHTAGDIDFIRAAFNWDPNKASNFGYPDDADVAALFANPSDTVNTWIANHTEDQRAAVNAQVDAWESGASVSGPVPTLAAPLVVLTPGDPVAISHVQLQPAHVSRIHELLDAIEQGCATFIHFPAHLLSELRTLLPHA